MLPNPYRPGMSPAYLAGRDNTMFDKYLKRVYNS
jgi:hypothetical protein